MNISDIEEGQKIIITKPSGFIGSPGWINEDSDGSLMYGGANMDEYVDKGVTVKMVSVLYVWIEEDNGRFAYDPNWIELYVELEEPTLLYGVTSKNVPYTCNRYGQHVSDITGLPIDPKDY